MADLVALTSLGAQASAVITVGPVTLTERFDVALASVAARRGRMLDLGMAAQIIDLPLPDAARHKSASDYSAFWVAPEMWFVEASFATHELIAERLKSALGDAASITEQTDAWVAFDLAAPDLSIVLERLCSVDFGALPISYATRTVIDHLGVYLIKHAVGAARIYGPRSSAESLLHAIETAAAAAF